MRMVFVFAFITSIFLFFGPEVSFSKDITAQVINETDFDEQIAIACRNHCQGNRREGRLQNMSIIRLGQHQFRVNCRASFKNHHHQDPPKVLGVSVGGGFAVYNYTIYIKAEGILDERTCKLQVTSCEVTNSDFLAEAANLDSLARGEIGKIYDIPNCQRFTNGL